MKKRRTNVSSSNPPLLKTIIIVCLTVGLLVGISALSNIWHMEPEFVIPDAPANTLTVNEKHMWQLNLNDDLLNNSYEQAYYLVTQEMPDAKLCEFDIDVFPYSRVSKVRLTYCFYSESADREIDYFFNDRLEITLERDITGVAIVNRSTFDTPPWIATKGWLQPIKIACEKTGSLDPSYATGYLVWVVNSPELTWNININDSVNWHWSLFKWNGRGDPVFVKKFGEDVTISHLLYYP
ncbi:MAG: hypothetical protein PHG35_07670 [Dehalococcoidales bacterium]|nr:hypothetical protein [Dehalococcoidales bacterium]